MTTHNVINSPLANSSGSGNFVGSTSPALSPVTIGAATATTIDFVYPNDEMFGTTNADNANSGIVGEYISSVIPFASAVSIGTASATNLTRYCFKCRGLGCIWQPILHSHGCYFHKLWLGKQHARNNARCFSLCANNPECLCIKHRL